MEEDLVIPRGRNLCPQSRYVMFQVVSLGPVVEVNQRRRIGRIATKSIGLVAVNGGKLPFIPISLRYAGNNAIYGGFLAYGNIGSFAAISTVVLLRIIDQELRPLSEEDVEMKGRNNCCSLGQAIRLLTCTTVGLGAQVAMAYLVFEYNNDSWGLAALTFSLESLLPIYSIWSSFESCSGRRRAKKMFETKLFDIRSEILGVLCHNEAVVPNLSLACRNELIESLEGLQSGCDLKSVHAAIALLLQPISPREQPSCLRTAGHYGSLAVGGALSAGFILFNGRLGQQAAAMASGGSAWYTYVAGVAVAGCLSKFVIDGVLFTSSRIYNVIVDRCKGRQPLGYRARPLLHSGLNLLALVTAALAYGPTMEGVEGAFEQGGLRIAEQVLSTGAVTLLALFGLLNVVDTICEESGKGIEREDIGKMVKLVHGLRRLRAMYTRSPLVHFARHLEDFPADILDDLLLRADATREDLTAYVSQHVPDETFPLLLNSEKGDLVEYV